MHAEKKNELIILFFTTNILYIFFYLMISKLSWVYSFVYIINIFNVKKSIDIY